MRRSASVRGSTAGASVALACILFAIASALGGCARPLPPQDVADRFWRAVSVQSAAKIRRYVRVEDRAQLSGDPEILPIADYTLGKIVIEGDRATVETRVTLAGDKPLPLTIDTALVQQEGQWRVDYTATVDRISMQSDLANVIDQLDAFGDALKQGIDKSVDEMKKVVPEIEKQLSRIESEIRQRMPELRERLEEFSRRIEESLKKPPAESGAGEPAEPIAI